MPPPEGPQDMVRAKRVGLRFSTSPGLKLELDHSRDTVIRSPNSGISTIIQSHETVTRSPTSAKYSCPDPLAHAAGPTIIGSAPSPTPSTPNYSPFLTSKGSKCSFSKWLSPKKSANNTDTESYTLDDKEYTCILTVYDHKLIPSPVVNLEAKLGEQKDNFRTIEMRCCAAPVKDYTFAEITLHILFCEPGSHIPIHVKDYGPMSIDQTWPTREPVASDPTSYTTEDTNKFSADLKGGSHGVEGGGGYESTHKETHSGTESVKFQGSRLGGECTQWTWTASTLNHPIGNRKFWVKLVIGGEKKPGMTACILVRCKMRGFKFFGGELKCPKTKKNKYERITLTHLP